MDIQGRELQRLHSEAGKMTLPTTSLQPGIYLVQLFDLNGNASKMERLVVR
jgi:hypothetical protein